MKINSSNNNESRKVAMKRKTLNVELIGYIIILLIAILIRFQKLGFVPLSDLEASVAIDAVNLVNNSSQIYSNQILLINLTGVLTFIFGENNFLIRFLPAVIGCMLVVTPYFFRKFVDKRFLIFISFWLAIDPGFVALSRQVNSDLLTLLLGSWFLLSLLNKKFGLSGILLGLLFLCGTSFWVGFLPIVITSFILKYLVKLNNSNHELIKLISGDIQWKKMFLFFGVTIIFGSSMAFIFPGQFGNILNGFISYVQGWFTPGIIAFWPLIRTLMIYNIALFLLGFIGLGWLIRNLHDTGYAIGILLLVNLVHLLLYPQRSVGSMIWVILPLLLSSTIFIVSHISLSDTNSKTVFIITGYGLIFVGFMSLISLKIFSPSWQQIQNSDWSLALVAFGMILILLAIFLVGWTISWKTAGKSFLYISIIFLGVYTLSASWNAGGLRVPYHNEMWWIDQNPIDEDLVVNTIKDHSEWYSGSPKSAIIQVINFDYPSIRWALREYENVEYTDIFIRSSNPQMIISRIDDQIEMVDLYRGQDFTWNGITNWPILSLGEWETWLLSRRVPNEILLPNNILLWIRNDLFPGAEN